MIVNLEINEMSCSIPALVLVYDVMSVNYITVFELFLSEVSFLEVVNVFVASSQ